jgi:hypothetical protein
MTTTEERIQNASHRLNAEAYEMQVIANGNKPLKQFSPCEKSVMLLKALREGVHITIATQDAARTYCACHKELDFNGLLNYEFDPTYKEANFKHDYKTLYPRLCSPSRPG